MGAYRKGRHESAPPALLFGRQRRAGVDLPHRTKWEKQAVLLALFDVGSASSETMKITLLAGGPVRRIATQQQPVMDRDFVGIIGPRTCKR